MKTYKESRNGACRIARGKLDIEADRSEQIRALWCECSSCTFPTQGLPHGKDFQADKSLVLKGLSWGIATHPCSIPARLLWSEDWNFSLHLHSSITQTIKGWRVDQSPNDVLLEYSTRAKLTTCPPSKTWAWLPSLVTTKFASNETGNSAAWHTTAKNAAATKPSTSNDRIPVNFAIPAVDRTPAWRMANTATPLRSSQADQLIFI